MQEIERLDVKRHFGIDYSNSDKNEIITGLCFGTKYIQSKKKTGFLVLEKIDLSN